MAVTAACCVLVAATAASGAAVSYTVDKARFSIDQSLTGKPGDPANGKKVVISRKLGNCLACHTMPIPDQAFQGRIGPTLNGVGARYEIGQLRLRVVDAKQLNPMTIMPAFLKSEGLNQVKKEFEGKSILTAQEIEDVIAYLATLK
jgi:sulfur-oxidizing protein SoxX